MPDVSRRTALALGIGTATGLKPGSAAATSGLPASPVSAVLAKHPWINQPHYIETNALAGKLAELLGWPSSATRSVVRAAYEMMLEDRCDESAFLLSIDRRIAAILASNEPLPRDRVDGPDADGRFAEMVSEIEQRLVSKSERIKEDF